MNVNVNVNVLFGPWLTLLAMERSAAGMTVNEERTMKGKRFTEERINAVPWKGWRKDERAVPAARESPKQRCTTGQLRSVQPS